MTRVAVIGAGVSGLSAALFALRAGHEVVLYEPGSLGGVVKTTHREGFTLEHGPNVLLERPELWELLREVGMEDAVRFPVVARYKQHVWCNDQICEVPRSPLKFFSSPLFPLSLKLRLPFLLFARSVAQPTADDESVGTYFGRFLGSQVVERVLGPALQGIYGGDVSRLSARTIFPELWEATKKGGSLASYGKTKSKRRTLVFEGGMASLTEGIVRALKGRFALVPERVRSLRAGKEGQIEIDSDSQRAVSFGRVVVTTSGASSASIIAEVDPALASHLAELPYAPIVVVHVAVSAREPLVADSFGVLFPSGRSDSLLGIMFNSILFPHTAPAGQHLLTMCFGGVNGRQVLARSDAEIQAAAAEALSTVLGVSECRVLALHRWESAIPQYQLGHWKLVEQLHQLEARVPGLVFVGSDMGGVGVPDRIRATRALFAPKGV